MRLNNAYDGGVVAWPLSTEILFECMSISSMKYIDNDGELPL
jgi:hypothetical protein